MLPLCIQMNKQEYIDRLLLASNHARELAMSLEYVNVNLPKQYCYSLYWSDYTPDGKNNEQKIKFLGGRFLDRNKLKQISPARAGELLWVDGSVPEWVNICVIAYSTTHTEFEVMFARRLVEADPEKLWPDYGMPPGNELAPFRVRGPSVADWEATSKNA